MSILTKVLFNYYVCRVNEVVQLSEIHCWGIYYSLLLDASVDYNFSIVRVQISLPNKTLSRLSIQSNLSEQESEFNLTTAKQNKMKIYH